MSFLCDRCEGHWLTQTAAEQHVCQGLRARRASAMDTCKVIEVVETTLTRRGEGRTHKDPVRVITQYWSRGGQLLAEVDPFTPDPEPTAELLNAAREMVEEIKRYQPQLQQTEVFDKLAKVVARYCP